MKTFILFLSLVVIFPFITNAQEKISKNQKTPKTVVVKIKDFENKAGKLIGHEIQITGIVDHVCKHGGKKLFLVDENSDTRVKVTTGKNMAAFTQDLVGETITVKGFVVEQRVDEEYLNEMEGKINTGTVEKGEKIHLGDHKDEKAKKDEDTRTREMDKVNKLRQQVEDSGKDYISFFSIQATGYKIVDNK